MTTKQKKIGNQAEKQACEFLIKKGMRLLSKNYQCYHGEIDLIMQDTEHIVFVEVRCRTKSPYASALESITPSKIKKIVKAATHYLQKIGLLYKTHSRFDVVAIELNNNNANKRTNINWIKNAFTP